MFIVTSHAMEFNVKWLHFNSFFQQLLTDTRRILRFKPWCLFLKSIFCLCIVNMPLASLNLWVCICVLLVEWVHMYLYIVETLITGLCSGNSISFSMLGSPASAVTASESLVSVQFYKSFSAYERNGSGSGSPMCVIFLSLFLFLTCLVKELSILVHSFDCT